MDHRTCALDGCAKPVKPRHSKCSMHVARIARHGDPAVVIAPSERRIRRGPASASWTPEASYHAVHQRLRNERGLAKAHQCADCSRTAQQWSYDRTDPDERRGPWPYSLDLSRYVPRCVSCHKRFDLARLA